MMGPIRRVRYRRARRETDRAKAAFAAAETPENRRALILAYATEARIKYAKVLKKLADR